ncbi:MAG: DUF1440 domain-containing protein [Ktedonobacteraceae bacterium]|nr:DUF1440 domain-containing protein [Ktedonobacteraceae bacterium]
MKRDQQLTASLPPLSWRDGALAGFIATAPMTVFMLATQRFLPHGQRYTLPPEVITSDLARRLHMRHHLTKRQLLAASLASHFLYGAAMGAFYRPLSEKISLPSPLKGGLFGLFVWAINYLGLLPLLGVPVSAPGEPLRRNLLMIGAHFVWGSGLGAITRLRNTISTSNPVA